jgi:hypothetical protein
VALGGGRQSRLRRFEVVRQLPGPRVRGSQVGGERVALRALRFRPLLGSRQLRLRGGAVSILCIAAT